MRRAWRNRTIRLQRFRYIRHNARNSYGWQHHRMKVFQEHHLIRRLPHRIVFIQRQFRVWRCCQQRIRAIRIRLRCVNDVFRIDRKPPQRWVHTLQIVEQAFWFIRVIVNQIIGQTLHRFAGNLNRCIRINRHCWIRHISRISDFIGTISLLQCICSAIGTRFRHLEYISALHTSGFFILVFDIEKSPGRRDKISSFSGLILTVFILKTNIGNIRIIRLHIEILIERLQQRNDFIWISGNIVLVCSGWARWTRCSVWTGASVWYRIFRQSNFRPVHKTRSNCRYDTCNISRSRPVLLNKNDLDCL